MCGDSACKPTQAELGWGTRFVPRFLALPKMKKQVLRCAQDDKSKNTNSQHEHLGIAAGKECRIAREQSGQETHVLQTQEAGDTPSEFYVELELALPVRGDVGLC